MKIRNFYLLLASPSPLPSNVLYTNSALLGTKTIVSNNPINSFKCYQIFFALVLAFFLSGCGYTIGEIKPTSMRHINTIAVGTFHNKTVIPRLEAQTADAVIKQFQQDGTYRIETMDSADAILTGTIVSVDRQPMRVFASNVMQSSEFELVVTVEYTVMDRRTGAILLKGQASGHAPFFINSDSVNSDLVMDQNINYPLAAQRMATGLVSKVCEGW